LQLFYYLFKFEKPNENFMRNATAHRVQVLKDRVVQQLWRLSVETNGSAAFALYNVQAENQTDTTVAAIALFEEWSAIANAGFFN
jgi:hypothetical protein